MWIGFVIGMFVGAILGMLVFGVLAHTEPTPLDEQERILKESSGKS